MDWDAMGAVGEIIGAVAVVLSLFYIGSQVRHSSTAVRGQTYESLSSSLVDVTMQIAGDAVLSEAFSLAGAGGELAPEHSRRIVSVFHAYTRISATAHYQHQLGLLDLEQLKNLTTSNALHLASPVGQRYWASARSFYPAAFVAYTDEAIRSVDSDLQANIRSLLSG